MRLFLLFFSALLFAAQLSGKDKPNVLLILADDLGYSDLGCYGGEIETPNLDSIAKNGLQFTQFYNTARCWPTRGALMTGFYAQQIRRDSLPGIPSGGGNRGKRPDWAKLLPDILNPVGYRSYHTGKWHIDGMPGENGFDHSYYLKDQGRFFNPTKHWKDDKPLPPVEKGTDYYATTALADHVIEVLSKHDEKFSDQPFFHYLAFAAPHFPLHALPEDIAVYEERYKAGWEKIRAQRWERVQSLGLLEGELSAVETDLGPPYHFQDALAKLGAGEVNRPLPWEELSDEQKDFQADKMAIHAAMIHRMDIEIGRVFDQIKKMEEWENTLVIFLSDNGASAEIMVRDDGHDPEAPRGSAATYLCLGPGWSTACNTPFRRHKTWTHEGGTSTPLLMAWPNGISARGELRRSPGHVVDIAPTILELANHCFAEEAPRSPGKSLVPLLNGKDELKRDSFWWFHDGHKAIRMGNWKAVSPEDEPWELYDIAKDRDESNNLAAKNPDKLKSLVDDWDRQLKEFTVLATKGLTEEELKPSTPNVGQKKMKAAKDAAKKPKGKGKSKAKPKREKVLINGEQFQLNGKDAFLMKPDSPAPGNPWIFYGPTLPAYPDKAESWMHQKFLKAGIAVAGIDVGEAYGSPKAFPHFEALHKEMLKRGHAKKPALLGRSRGGLWVSSWAIKHPERVAGIGGIYPVYDLTTYPGTNKAAGSYGLSEEELVKKLDELNPIRRADILAKANIPVFIIHGIDDKVVPLKENSATLASVYNQNKAGNLIEIIKIPGQGHSFWPGFFHCQELVDFLIEKATSAAKPK